MAREPVEASGATRVRIGGRERIFFGGCSYLGLHAHPAVLDAARRGLDRYGLSAGASRETTGETRAHLELEEALARAFGAPAALTLAAGSLANLALAEDLARERPGAIVDAEVHASARNALRCAGAAISDVPHAGDFAPLLEATRAAGASTIVWTDGVYPSAAHVAPVAALHDAASSSGALVVVDDAHGVGAWGERGLGAAEGAPLDDDRVVLSLTFSKALGVGGGAIVGTRERIESIRRASSAHMGSTPLPPALACATHAALDLALGDSSIRARLRANVARVHAILGAAGLPVPPLALPVFAFALDDHAAMDALERGLDAAGIRLPLVEYPSGPTPRYFRGVVSAAHTDEELDRLEAALTAALR